MNNQNQKPENTSATIEQKKPLIKLPAVFAKQYTDAIESEYLSKWLALAAKDKNAALKTIFSTVMTICRDFAAHATERLQTSLRPVAQQIVKATQVQQQCNRAIQEATKRFRTIDLPTAFTRHEKTEIEYKRKLCYLTGQTNDDLPVSSWPRWLSYVGVFVLAGFIIGIEVLLNAETFKYDLGQQMGILISIIAAISGALLVHFAASLKRHKDANTEAWTTFRELMKSARAKAMAERYDLRVMRLPRSVYLSSTLFHSLLFALIGLIVAMRVGFVFQEGSALDITDLVGTGLIVFVLLVYYVISLFFGPKYAESDIDELERLKAIRDGNTPEDPDAQTGDYVYSWPEVTAAAKRYEDQIRNIIDKAETALQQASEYRIMYLQARNNGAADFFFQLGKTYFESIGISTPSNYTVDLFVNELRPIETVCTEYDRIIRSTEIPVQLVSHNTEDIRLMIDQAYEAYQEDQQTKVEEEEGKKKEVQLEYERQAAIVDFSKVRRVR